MEATLPRYLLVPPGFDPGPLLDRLGREHPLHEVPSIDGLLLDGPEGDPRQPGWVFVPPETEPATVVELLVRLSKEKGAWSPLLLIEGDNGLSIVPASPGFFEDSGTAMERMEGEAVRAGLLSFRLGLEELARLRHDVNNSLAAAFAEVQLLIMDVDEASEIAESLRATEVQLRRVRDLVADLAVFRMPRF